MIKIKPIKHANYNTGFIVEGHAGLTPHGSDILCSAVSASVAVLERQLQYIKDEEYFTLLSTTREGYKRIEIESHLDHSDWEGFAEAVIQGWYDVMEQLAKQYPDNIKVEEWVI